jgi:hypothetical protein
MEYLGASIGIEKLRNNLRLFQKLLLNLLWISSSSYDVPAINQHVHFIHVMAYGYHSPEYYSKIIYLFFL